MAGTGRSKRWVIRVVGAVAAGLIVADVLTYEGSGWFDRLWRIGEPAARGAALVREPAKSGPIGLPIMVTPMRPRGNDSSISPTPLPLILVSTSPGRNSREGSAQLGVNAQTPQTYGAGALLANQARLTEIYARYVVLERDGRAVRLYRQGEPQATSEPTSAITSGEDAGLLTVGGTPQAAPQPANSHESLTEVLRPTPVFAGQTIRGFALYSGRDPGVFAQLGLEEGDVLTQINGQATRNPTETMAALETLTQGAALSVQIERQGVPKALSLDGSAVVSALAKHAAPDTAVKMNGKETTT